MFGTGHPQPPPQRKEVAMQIVQQQRRDFDAHHLQVEPPGGAVALPAAAPALAFDVVYTLAEYLDFVRDHLAFVLRRQPRATRLRQVLGPLAVALPAAQFAFMAMPGWASIAAFAVACFALAFLPAAGAAWVALLGTPVFLLKKRRMPRCAFRIDAAGIARSTRAGTVRRSWAEVNGMRRYRHGYLLMSGKGGIPIPYRCLDAQQQAALRRFAEVHL